MKDMTEQTPFAKMNGAGNEILVVDMRGKTTPVMPQVR